MGIPVFLVELIHPHTKRRWAKVYCSAEFNPSCDGPHELDDDGRRRHSQPRRFTDHVCDVRRLDSGEVIATDSWGGLMLGIPGAMFWFDLEDHRADERQPKSTVFRSGPQLYCILPDKSPWNIDSRASNCTMPDDFEHRCWVRHGIPPAITVDKDGLTCTAGGGSIQSGSWHGYLRNGELVE
jgi:hypothetical protein